MTLSKRFSVAHYDNWTHPSLYYEAIARSSPQFRDEIYDIYFGKVFRYSYRGQETYDSRVRHHQVVYGNVMGVEASDEQVAYLLRIQAEFGIRISLTVNQLNIPIDLFYSRGDRVLRAFIDWLQDFYDRGVRSCTLANSHLMRDGVLQDRFPEMTWKNTVNQQVSSAQEVLDYLSLGYHVIQLDRSLNRNMDELKRIKDVVENYKSKHPGRYVETCLLVRENCMPFCPFKREHDDLQMHHRTTRYWDTGLWALSCGRWLDVMGSCGVPRTGTNCFWSSVETFNEYAELVDIFKYSGRLGADCPGEDVGRIQFKWVTEAGNHAIDCFSDIVEDRVEPVHLWFPGTGSGTGDVDTTKVREELKDDFFMTEGAKRLEQKLKNCRNQCYNCHLCERTFGLPDFDSLVEL